MFSFDTHEDGGGPPLTIPWVNPFSALVPSLAPVDVLFSGRLVLDRRPPIIVGREVFGYDKHLGAVVRRDATTDDGRFKASLVADGVSAELAVDGSAAGMFATAVALTQALGLTDPAQLPPPASEFHQVGATWNALQPTKVSGIDGFARWNPTMSAWNPTTCRLNAAPGSPLGELLRRVRFEPAVVAHDPNFAIVIDDAR
jgi:hypothetical protein